MIAQRNVVVRSFLYLTVAQNRINLTLVKGKQVTVSVTETSET